MPFVMLNPRRYGRSRGVAAQLAEMAQRRAIVLHNGRLLGIPSIQVQRHRRVIRELADAIIAIRAKGATT